MKNETRNLITDPEIFNIWPRIPWDQLRNCISSTNPNQTWEDFLLGTGTLFCGMTYEDVVLLRTRLSQIESATPSRKSELKLLGILVSSVDLITNENPTTE